MRLAKYLAHCGVASRRSAERLVADGRVTVAGVAVTDPARAVDDASEVAVDGAPVVVEPREVWVVNKPAGVVSTAADRHAPRIVTELVDSARRLYPVGRLDADTTGLILLTNDGGLAERLTHPRYGVPKTYRARVAAAPVSAAALDALRGGVELDDGRSAPASAHRLDSATLEITISEGRKRQVRRMLEAVGHPVTELERTGFGPLRIEHAGDGGTPLAAGAARRLTRSEVGRLREAAGASRQTAPSQVTQQ